jgi:hypothetical protein
MRGGVRLVSTMTLWRALETLHGHLAVLAAAALIHPAILLRRGSPLSRGARWAIGLGTLAVVLAFTLGLVIYPAYTQEVRTPLFFASPRAGLLFETKEHWAFMVVSIAVGAAVASLAAPLTATALRRTSALFYALAAALCLATAGLGSVTATIHGF